MLLAGSGGAVSEMALSGKRMSSCWTRTAALLALCLLGAGLPSCYLCGACYPAQALSEAVVFRLVAPEAKSVSVVGSFNRWNAEKGLMKKDGKPGLWELRADVPPGSHEYTFIVDGRPFLPPEANTRVADGFGGENGVVTVTD